MNRKLFGFFIVFLLIPVTSTAGVFKTVNNYDVGLTGWDVERLDTSPSASLKVSHNDFDDHVSVKGLELVKNGEFVFFGTGDKQLGKIQLNTPGDLSDGGTLEQLITYINPDGQDSDPSEIEVSPNGDTILIYSYGSGIFQHEMTSSYDITSFTNGTTNRFKDESGSWVHPDNLYVSEKGDTILSLEDNGGTVYKGVFNTRWDATTVDWTVFEDVQWTQPYDYNGISGLDFKPDGTEAYNYLGGYIVQYSLSEGFNTNTSLHVGAFDTNAGDTNFGAEPDWSDDGMRMFLGRRNNCTGCAEIYQFSISE